MLKLLRSKNIKKAIFWALVVLIMPAFVLWGSGSIGGPKNKGPKYAGLIEGKKISFDELYGSILAIRTQVFLNYFTQPQLVDSLLKNRQFVAKMAWDRLIMVREAERREIKVPDADVIKFIRSHPMFVRNGVFDERLYGYILRNNMGLDARQFEEIARENLKLQRLNDAIATGIKVSDEEALDEYRSEASKFKISYVLIEPKGFISEAKIDDAMARDYYDINKKEFTVPAASGDPDAAPQTAEFDGVKASIKTYLAEKEANAISAKYAEEAREKIAGIVETDKLPFEKAAEKLGLKAQDSQLFSRSDNIEGVGEAAAVADEALKLALGKVSLPVKTRQGIIIFKVSEFQGPDEAAFQKEKEEYSKKALEKKKNAYLEKWLQGLEDKTRLNIDFADIDKYYR